MYTGRFASTSHSVGNAIGLATIEAVEHPGPDETALEIQAWTHGRDRRRLLEVP